MWRFRRDTLAEYFVRSGKLKFIFHATLDWKLELTGDRIERGCTIFVSAKRDEWFPLSASWKNKKMEVKADFRVEIFHDPPLYAQLQMGRMLLKNEEVDSFLGLLTKFGRKDVSTAQGTEAFVLNTMPDDERVRAIGEFFIDRGVFPFANEPGACFFLIEAVLKKNLPEAWEKKSVKWDEVRRLVSDRDVAEAVVDGIFNKLFLKHTVKKKDELISLVEKHAVPALDRRKPDVIIPSAYKKMALLSGEEVLEHYRTARKGGSPADLKTALSFLLRLFLSSTSDFDEGSHVEALILDSTRKHMYGESPKVVAESADGLYVKTEYGVILHIPPTCCSRQVIRYDSEKNLYYLKDGKVAIGLNPPVKEEAYKISLRLSNNPDRELTEEVDDLLSLL